MSCRPDSSYVSEASLKNLDEKNSPCKPESCYHDLVCGHRIRTTHPEDCGSNCNVPQQEEQMILDDDVAKTSPMTSFKFLCEACIRDEVHMQAMIEELEVGESGPTRERAIQVLAERAIRERISQGARFCLMAKKMETGVMQYFESFPEAHQVTVKDVESQPTFKRPGSGTRVSRSSASTRHHFNPYGSWRPKVREAEHRPAQTTQTRETTMQVIAVPIEEADTAANEDTTTQAVRLLLKGLVIQQPVPPADEVSQLLAGLSFET
jgi:hypothetical protein